jgi:ATP-binding cassette subfamily B protein
LHAAVRFALPQRHAILLIVALVLAVAGLNAFEPLILKGLFDQLTGPERAGAILFGILLLLGFAVAREIMDGFANWLTWRTRSGCNMRCWKRRSASCIGCRFAFSAAKASAPS